MVPCGRRRRPALDGDLGKITPAPGSVQCRTSRAPLPPGAPSGQISDDPRPSGARSAPNPRLALMAARSATKEAPRRAASTADADWRRIAYHVLVSRARDDLEEATNRNPATVPRGHVVRDQV